jgi:hypothetical protein
LRLPDHHPFNQIIAHHMKKYLILLGLACSTTLSYGQQTSRELLWSPDHKLTVADFGIRNQGANAQLSFAQFSLDYAVGGFDFLSRKFNKKVRNVLIPSASWIDTTRMVARSLRYQQTLFDIGEIYARRFRKKLAENRKMIARGTAVVQQWETEIATALSQRRLAYDLETQSGADEARQKQWEDTIREELSGLAPYAFDK